MTERVTLRQAVFALPTLGIDDVVIVLDGELVAQGKIADIASDGMREAMSTPGAQIYLHPDAAADFARWIRMRSGDLQRRLH